jgi:two-component system alkaline phosphatase synthesis response regulator PhoP
MEIPGDRAGRGRRRSTATRTGSQALYWNVTKPGIPGASDVITFILDMTESEHPSILIIEDDESTGEAVAFHLTRAGFAPRLETDGLAGLQALKSGLPAVLVLDLMLPHIDGWHLIREVRSWAPNLPIIVMTARTNEHDRVEVLGLGADDVVSKPFSMRELVARVTAAVRRASVAMADAERKEIVAGDLVIDPDRLAVSISGEPIDLTPLEFKLLWVLSEHRGRALSRDVIYERVWRADRGHGDRSVDVLVRRLRRKVDEIDGAYTYIQTQHGVGYRFDAMLRRMPGTGVRDAQQPAAPRPAAMPPRASLVR